MTSIEESSSPESIGDEEHALRLLHPDWINGQTGKITSQAFSGGRPSLFIKERLPDGDGECLHIDRFTDWGRACLSVKWIRAVRSQNKFSLKFTPADPPLQSFSAAHTELHGPRSKGARRALAKSFNDHGEIERRPSR